MFHIHRAGDTYKFVIQSINYAFLAVFTTEAILKITAYGKAYFYDGWN